MGLTALRGAVGFLTRIPVGTDERSWEAFGRTPVTLPLVGYVIGGLALLPLLVVQPTVTAALVFVAWLYVLTGITHLDGLADVGDAAVVHGDRERRTRVLTDTQVGVGGVLAIALIVAGLGLAGLALAGAPAALGIVIAAEVGAKLGMAAVACLGTASHDGLGAEVTTHTTGRSLALPAIVALPAAALTWPHPAAAVALPGGILAGAVALWWASRRLGGVNGDVIGATNEVGRLVGLHLGVIAWTLW